MTRLEGVELILMSNDTQGIDHILPVPSPTQQNQGQHSDVPRHCLFVIEFQLVLFFHRHHLPYLLSSVHPPSRNFHTNLSRHPPSSPFSPPHHHHPPHRPFATSDQNLTLLASVAAHTGSSGPRARNSRKNPATSKLSKRTSPSLST